jgi:hypothetical protein
MRASASIGQRLEEVDTPAHGGAVKPAPESRNRSMAALPLARIARLT